jgi:hypothetical protein
MAISDKTRKILWGRSGNRCGLCRHELVIDATAADSESVVGEECHIVSGKTQGPRYNPTFSGEHLDEPENLILLCRIHHKMVDDQHETYTSEVLLNLKVNHEKWVSSTLAGEPQVPPVRIRRIKENIPPFLVRLTSGSEIMAVVGGAYQSSFDHEEPGSEAGADLFSEFLQEVQDWGESWNEVEAGERVKAAFRLSERLRGLEDAGFWVFGARETRRVEGGVGPSSPWPIAILRLVRADSAEIRRLTPETFENTSGKPTS